MLHTRELSLASLRVLDEHVCARVHVKVKTVSPYAFIFSSLRSAEGVVRSRIFDRSSDLQTPEYMLK